jgi:hypothetical protein
MFKFYEGSDSRTLPDLLKECGKFSDCLPNLSFDVFEDILRSEVHKLTHHSTGTQIPENCFRLPRKELLLCIPHLKQDNVSPSICHQVKTAALSLTTPKENALWGKSHRSYVEKIFPIPSVERILNALSKAQASLPKRNNTEDKLTNISSQITQVSFVKVLLLTLGSLFQLKKIDKKQRDSIKV